MTYSIVARDPKSGEMGVATQSQSFAVGSSVPWAMPGYGVIASQSMGEPMYGEIGLDLLRSGLTASEALKALCSIDPHPERRQVAMVDAHGRVGVYTGAACVGEAGHSVGAGCAALANMMTNDTVWLAMVEAYERAEGSFASRLLAALRRAEVEGGDIRGSRSAAILVVEAKRSGRPWQDHVVDLRVDDHENPVGKLERMLVYNARYHRVGEAFELALDGSCDAALKRLAELVVVPAEEPELALWEAIVLAKTGRIKDAQRRLEELAEHAPHFVETARRFGAARLIEPELLQRILPTSFARD